MLNNYIKVALRYLSRNRQYTLINITGLCIAICAGILIIQVVRNEYSYDKFHSKSSRIVRLWQDELYNGEKFISTSSPVSAAPVISAAYPEVEAYCRINPLQAVLKVGNNSFSEELRIVDTSIFQIFDFHLLKGLENRPFSGPSSIILTPELSKKLFGSADPMGQTVLVSLHNKEHSFTVTGIVQNSPPNSSIKFSCFIPYSNIKHVVSENGMKSWTNVSAESFFLLRNGVTAENLESKLPSLVKQYLGQNYKEGAFIFHLQPLENIHLNNDLPEGSEPVGNPKFSYILATIGVLLLLVASINFIILSLGRSVSRYREVGVRKVLGAGRFQLIKQYWGESLLITFVAGLIGAFLAFVLFSPFKSLLNLDLDFVIDLPFILYTFLLLFVIALLAGLYPAIVLSKHRPAATLRNTTLSGTKGSWFQSALITGQLIVSIALIVCTLTVRMQLNYIIDKDLGYKKDRLLVVETHQRTDEGGRTSLKLKEALQTYFKEGSSSVSLYSFVQSPWIELGFTNKEKVYKGFQYNSVDAEFIPAMGLALIAGRNFLPNNIQDSKNSAIVNESFVQNFQINDPIGKKLPGPFHQIIIGVVKDFNYMSLHNTVGPLCLTMQYDSILRVTENISLVHSPDPRLTLRLPAGSLTGQLQKVEEVWKKIMPAQEFDFKFVDDGLMALYENEKRTATIATIMAVLSIVIACLGLFGLATLNVARRTKEIGIRKVLGASHGVIVWLLTARIVRLTLIAALVTIPLAWWLLGIWLQSFAFHIELRWHLFVVASFIILLVAMITVSFQTVKAALTNPVKSLKTE